MATPLCRFTCNCLLVLSPLSPHFLGAARHNPNTFRRKEGLIDDSETEDERGGDSETEEVEPMASSPQPFDINAWGGCEAGKKGFVAPISQQLNIYPEGGCEAEKENPAASSSQRLDICAAEVNMECLANEESEDEDTDAPKVNPEGPVNEESGDEDSKRKYIHKRKADTPLVTTASAQRLADQETLPIAPTYPTIKIEAADSVAPGSRVNTDAFDNSAVFEALPAPLQAPKNLRAPEAVGSLSPQANASLTKEKLVDAPKNMEPLDMTGSALLKIEADTFISTTLHTSELARAGSDLLSQKSRGNRYNHQLFVEEIQHKCECEYQGLCREDE